MHRDYYCIINGNNDKQEAAAGGATTKQSERRRRLPVPLRVRVVGEKKKCTCEIVCEKAQDHNNRKQPYEKFSVSERVGNATEVTR